MKSVRSMLAVLAITTFLAIPFLCLAAETTGEAPKGEPPPAAATVTAPTAGAAAEAPKAEAAADPQKAEGAKAESAPDAPKAEAPAPAK